METNFPRRKRRRRFRKFSINHDILRLFKKGTVKKFLFIRAREGGAENKISILSLSIFWSGFPTGAGFLPPPPFHVKKEGRGLQTENLLLLLLFRTTHSDPLSFPSFSSFLFPFPYSSFSLSLKARLKSVHTQTGQTGMKFTERTSHSRNKLIPKEHRNTKMSMNTLSFFLLW